MENNETKEMVTKVVKLDLILSTKDGHDLACGQLPEEQKRLEVSQKNAIYNFFRNGQKTIAKWKNICISEIYHAAMECERGLITREECKSRQAEIFKKAARLPKLNDASYSLYSAEDLKNYPTGVANTIGRECNGIWATFLKTGLYSNSLPSFSGDKEGIPLLKAYVTPITQNSNGALASGMYHGYQSALEFDEGIHKDKDVKLYVKWVGDKNKDFGNNGIIFRLYLGNNLKKSAEKRETMFRIMNKEYSVCDSKIILQDGKIQLRLSYKMPVRHHAQLDYDKVCGVDCGLATTVMLAFNDNVEHCLFKRYKIGTYDGFIRVRNNIQRERRNLQAGLKYTSGGHGRKKKLRKMEDVKAKERNFAKSYNDKISREVIDTCLKHGVGTIHMEHLNGFKKEEKNNFVLRNWSYYELQNMIENKAKSEGIVVKYVEPAFTSQTCSCCGWLKTDALSKIDVQEETGILTREEAETARGLLEHTGRISQSIFVCGNPECFSHTKYTAYGTRKAGEINADFNAARNIANSKNAGTKKQLETTAKTRTQDKRSAPKTKAKKESRKKVA